MLREVQQHSDLPIFFEQQIDADAVRMAATQPRDHSTKMKLQERQTFSKEIVVASIRVLEKNAFVRIEKIPNRLDDGITDVMLKLG